MLKLTKNRNDPVAKHYQAASEYLQQDKIDEAMTHISYAEAHEKITHYNSARNQWRWRVGLMVVCLGLVSLGMLLHVKTTDIQLQVDADNIRLEGTTADTAIFGKSTLIGTALTLNDSRYFNTLPEKYSAFIGKQEKLQAGNVNIEASRIFMEEFTLYSSDKITDKNTCKVNINYRRNKIYIYFKNASASGSIKVNKPTAVSLEKSAQTYSYPLSDFAKLDNNASFYFSTGVLGTGATPGYITLENPGDIELHATGKTSIDFVQEYPPGSGRFQSTVIVGKLILSDTGRTIDLRNGDFLNIECKNCSHNTIRFMKHKQSLQLRGSVSELTGGLYQAHDNYMPTLLEFFYHNQKITMLWAGLIFVFGLLWNVRGYIR